MRQCGHAAMHPCRCVGKRASQQVDVWHVGTYVHMGGVRVLRHIIMTLRVCKHEMKKGRYPGLQGAVIVDHCRRGTTELCINVIQIVCISVGVGPSALV